jgi:hypothetical protein
MYKNRQPTISPRYLQKKEHPTLSGLVLYWLKNVRTLNLSRKKEILKASLFRQLYRL